MKKWYRAIPNYFLRPTSSCQRPWRLPVSPVHLCDTDNSYIHCLIQSIHYLISFPMTFSGIAAITHSSFLPQGHVLVKVKWLSVSCKSTQQWNRTFTSRRPLSSTFICFNLRLRNESGDSCVLGHAISEKRGLRTEGQQEVLEGGDLLSSKINKFNLHEQIIQCKYRSWWDL